MSTDLRVTNLENSSGGQPEGLGSGGSAAAGATTALAPASPGRGWLMKRISILGPPFLFSAAIVGVWYFVSYVVLKPTRRFLLPPPQSVIHVGLLTWFNLHTILDSLFLTMRAAGIGFAISIVLGIGIAVLMSQAKWIERSAYPWAVVLQTVPILAIVPLIGFAFGFNFRSRVIVCVLIALFPIITNTLFGLQSVDTGSHDLFTLQGVSRWTRLRKLEFPAALPAIFTGLRISAGLSVIGAIVGDFFFAQGQPGLGQLINLYRDRLESDQLYAAVIVSSLLGIFAFLLVGVVSNRVIGPWYESER